LRRHGLKVTPVANWFFVGEAKQSSPHYALRSQLFTPLVADRKGKQFDTEFHRFPATSPYRWPMVGEQSPVMEIAASALPLEPGALRSSQ
jgi:hypothetical protein